MIRLKLDNVKGLYKKVIVRVLKIMLHPQHSADQRETNITNRRKMYSFYDLLT